MVALLCKSSVTKPSTVFDHTSALASLTNTISPGQSSYRRMSLGRSLTGDKTMRLGIEPTVHASARVIGSALGRYVEVGARTVVAESTIGDYSYVVNDSDIIYATIGKFCSIAAHTRINPGN